MHVRRRWVGYLVAAAATAAVVAFRSAFDRSFGHSPHFLLPFVLPVMAAAWVGGGGPGLFATVTAVAAAAALFAAPDGGTGPSDWVRLGLLAAVGLFVAAVSEGMHRFRARAAADARRADARLRALEREAADRRAAEARLRAGEALLRLVTDSAPVMLVHCDRDGRYTFANAPYTARFGLTPPDVMGRTVADLLGADAYARIRPHVDAALAGTPAEFETEIPYRGLGPRTVHCAYRPARAADGTVTGFVAAITDVTERARAEDEVREARRMLRLVLDTIPIGVFWKDRESRYLGCNRVVAEALGLADPAELAGLTDADRSDLAPGEADFFVRKDREVMAGGVPQFHIRETMTVADGRTLWLDTNKVPMRDAAGRVVGVLGTWEDVTDRRAAEERFRHQELTLREAAELAHVGGWGFDPVTLKADWTPEVWRIHDLAAGTAPDLAEAINYYLPEDRGRLTEAVTAATASGTPYDLELRIVSATGVRKWVRAICRPTLEAGKVVRVRGSLQDITDRKRLEEQLNQSQKLEAVGRLAGGVAHDFNNLLTIINGYAELVLSALPAGDPTAALAAEILHAGERAAGLTAQLLAFGRKTVVTTRVIDLNAVVADAQTLLGRLIGEDVTLTTTLAPDLWPVRADAGHVGQVLMNLAANGRDAMPTGGRLTVETANADLDAGYAAARPDARPGPHVLLAVTDTGGGIPADLLPHVFEPFFTTKEVGRGTGLGLATVYGIVRQSGGHIAVYSEAGVGTVFKVYLPRAEPTAAPAPPAPPAAATPTPRSETVLLVEDDPAVRELTRQLLQRDGYAVLEAADGEEAVRVCAGHGQPIQLLVTDVVMPRMGGRATAERVAERHPGVKVLYVSGYTDDAVVRHGILREGVHFLQKPFTAAGLADKVRGILDGPATG